MRVYSFESMSDADLRSLRATFADAPGTTFLFGAGGAPSGIDRLSPKVTAVLVRYIDTILELRAVIAEAAKEEGPLQ